MTTEAEFHRLSISKNDFENAVIFAKEAQQHSMSTRAHEALVFAAIVSYCRPFSQNEKKKNNSPASDRLSLEDFRPLSETETKLHTQCEDLRNQALAHSEYKRNPTRLNTETGIISSSPFSLLAHAPEIDDLIALAKKLADECHHKCADYKRQQQMS